MDPTMLVIKDALEINNASSFTNPERHNIRCRKEVVYILTPSLE